MYGQYNPFAQGPFMMGQQQPPFIIMQMPGQNNASPNPRPPRGGGGGSRGPKGPQLNFKQMKKLNKKIKQWIKDEQGGDPNAKKDEKKDEPKKGLRHKQFNSLEVFGLMLVGALPMGLLVLGSVKAFTLLAKSFF